MRKRKNKAIAGRRNRVHRMGPIFIFREEYDDKGYHDLKSQLATAGANGFDWLLLRGREIEVHFPCQCKKPRIIQ